MRYSACPDQPFCLLYMVQPGAPSQYSKCTNWHHEEQGWGYSLLFSKHLSLPHWPRSDLEFFDIVCLSVERLLCSCF